MVSATLNFFTTKNCPTKRAVDWRESARLTSIFLASVFSCSQALSQPARQPLTRAVSLHPRWSITYVSGKGSNMSIACPIDSKDDTIQKVSAVVSGGQAKGTFSGPTGGVTYSDGKWGSVGGFSVLSGSSSTELAELLSPPPQPYQDKAWWVQHGCGTFLIVMGVLAAIVIPASGAGDPTTSIFERFLIASVMGGLWVGLGLLFRAWGGRQKKVSDEKYSKEMNAWSTAMNRWSHLYYCYKHDIVFDPENGEQCEPAKLKEFINKPIAG